MNRDDIQQEIEEAVGRLEEIMDFVAKGDPTWLRSLVMLRHEHRLATTYDSRSELSKRRVVAGVIAYWKAQEEIKEPKNLREELERIRRKDF
jgi:hypothetical protein